MFLVFCLLHGESAKLQLWFSILKLCFEVTNTLNGIVHIFKATVLINLYQHYVLGRNEA